MGYFEKMADFSMMPSFALTPLFRALFYSTSRFRIYIRSVLYMALKKKEVVVFVNLISVEKYERQLSFLRKHFKLTFVIDTYDKSLSENPIWIDKDEKWFAPHIENVDSNSGNLIPVGVEPLKWNRNGKIRNLKYSQIPLNGKVLIGPFKMTHPSRNQLLVVESTKQITVLSARLSPEAYAKLTESFDFILCPRGNGIDTHRLWETLYRGRIPILIESKHTRYFVTFGLPLLLCKSFDEVYKLTRKELINIATEMQFDPKSLPPLQPRFWWDFIQTGMKK
jgi:hypothetical protein